jgi:kumamolisin
MRTEVVRGHLLSQWLAEDGWRTAAPERVIRATVVFRPEREAEIRARLADPDSEPVASVTDLHRLFRPDPAVVVRLASYLEDHGLEVAPPRAEGLYLDVAGPIARMTAALRCTFAERHVEGRHVYLNREEPQVPVWAVDAVGAIVGLENRAGARPAHRYPRPEADLPNGGRGYFPRDIRAAYRFPTHLDGKGQTIALLEFGSGFAARDVEAFWREHGVPVRPVAFVSVDGTPNSGGGQAVDVECTLDVEWAGALAPEASLVVYEASPGADDVSWARAMLLALEAVVTDEVHRPSVVSISYGDAESRIPRRALWAWDLAAQRAAARGISVLAASGDMGAYGVRGIAWPFPHVDAPASLPHVWAVGGTTLRLAPDGTRLSETGWSDTNDNGASGGGVSLVFPLPGWQESAGVPANPEGRPGRGVPDGALVADPDTGVAIVFDGEPAVIGGTSASTPMWAALVALTNQARSGHGRSPLGLLAPRLYPLGRSPVFHDIVQGTNRIDGIAGYQCGPGWDPVTGWGSVDATTFVERLG